MATESRITPEEKDLFLDSEAICMVIRGRVAALAMEPYDDTSEEARLPLRPDVRQFMDETLCPPEKPVLAASGLPLPNVHKKKDGTISLRWLVPEGYLLIDIPCAGIVCCYRGTPGLGMSIKETHRHLNPTRLYVELNCVLQWLREIHLGGRH